MPELLFTARYIDRSQNGVLDILGDGIWQQQFGFHWCSSCALFLLFRFTNIRDLNLQHIPAHSGKWLIRLIDRQPIKALAVVARQQFAVGYLLILAVPIDEEDDTNNKRPIHRILINI